MLRFGTCNDMSMCDMARCRCGATLKMLSHLHSYSHATHIPCFSLLISLFLVIARLHVVQMKVTENLNRQTTTASGIRLLCSHNMFWASTCISILHTKLKVNILNVSNAHQVSTRTRYPLLSPVFSGLCAHICSHSFSPLFSLHRLLALLVLRSVYVSALPHKIHIHSYVLRCAHITMEKFQCTHIR